jgi:hypothetical protein
MYAFVSLYCEELNSMPNNLIFNNVAEQLLTQIYGNNNGTPKAISVDASGNLNFRDLTGATDSVSIFGTVTVTTDTVAITSTDLDIRDLSGATDSVSIFGTVTVTTDIVTVTSTDLDIRDLSGATDSVSIFGTVTVTTDIVTVTSTELDIRKLSGATDSVIIAGNTFTESSATITSGTGASVTLTADCSQQSIYSFYVRNTGAAAITAKLQISPTISDAYFIDDPSGAVSIEPGASYVLVAQRFLKYTRLAYDTGGSTASFEAFFNAHV